MGAFQSNFLIYIKARIRTVGTAFIPGLSHVTVHRSKTLEGAFQNLIGPCHFTRWTNRFRGRILFIGWFTPDI